MAVSDSNSIYYDIVFEAKAAIQTLRTLGDAGAEFENIVSRLQTEITALAESVNADTSVIASAFRKMNSDISAANRERIQENITNEQQATVALEEERAQYVALDAAIAQAAKNVQAPMGAAVPVTPFPPEVLANYEALVKDVQSATLAMSQMQAAGASNKDMQMALGDSMELMAAKYRVDLPVITDLFRQMGVNVNLTDEQIQAMATRAAQMQLKANIKEAEQALNDASGAGREFGNVLRMIEGVAVAMVVFQVFQTISQAIRDATDNAQRYEQSLQNIIVAQDAMARSGVQVTNQQLLDMADALHQKFQQISQTDMVQVVAQASLLTANYGFSVQQVQQISEQAAILYRLDPSKPAAEYVAQLVKALEGSRSLAANNEQIAITATQIKDKAIELGLIGENYKGTLSDQVKMQASLAIEQERLIPEAEALAKTNDSFLSTSEKLKATWTDYTRLLGEELEPVINAISQLLIGILTSLVSVGNTMGGIFETALKAVGTYFAFIVQMGSIANQVLSGHISAILGIADAWKKAQDAADAAFNKVFGGGMNINQNTPVSPVPSGLAAGATQEPDLSKVDSYLNSVAKDYQSYYDGVQKAQENFNTKMQDLQDQYNLNVQKEVENTNLRMAEEKQNYRLKELKAEQDFQQKMRDLTARYLLDLEDGLRHNDAEAVIRTIERYNMEKTSAEQHEDLRITQDKKAEEVRLSQMKQEEELRLKQMAEEYALQQQKAQQAYNQQLADLQTSLKSKLEEEAAKIGQEYNMNSDGMDKLLSLFNDYYGPDGQFAKSQQGSYLKMIEQSGAFVAQMETIIGQYFQTMGAMSAVMPGMTGPIVGSTNSGNYRGGGGTTQTPLEVPGNITISPPSSGMTTPHHQAAGGMALAASATDVTFGEAGPELAMFLPLNSSTSIPALGTTLGAGGQFGGQAVIALQVDPNLEARIVNTTLTHAAISIEKVYRTG